MKVDDVLRLLCKTFDLDYLDTLVEALRKHLKDEEPKTPTKTMAPANEFASGAAAGSFQRKM